jgi:hypothetical protein
MMKPERSAREAGPRASKEAWAERPVRSTESGKP